MAFDIRWYNPYIYRDASMYASMYAMQEKKVDKNTFAEKSEDVWSAMQEVRLGPGLPRKFSAQISRKLERFLLLITAK
jgi:hypothetical protein